ncbi:hypothetical protein EUGRSUZ_A00790 [Eucalyptus grandis]|uniref:Uncharacterized protein n=2 Tax=Eucalyptus grandis TaxID=71139 RepID=A0ACC3M1Y6_EUCGR|nr:hypothetical protein EUGRSUZ_A00790 [Eucalyptus grandis]
MVIITQPMAKGVRARLWRRWWRFGATTARTAEQAAERGGDGGLGRRRWLTMARAWGGRWRFSGQDVMVSRAWGGGVVVGEAATSKKKEGRKEGRKEEEEGEEGGFRPREGEGEITWEEVTC